MFSVVFSVPDLLHQRCCAPIGQVLLLPLLAHGGTQLEQSVPANPPPVGQQVTSQQSARILLFRFFPGSAKGAGARVSEQPGEKSNPRAAKQQEQHDASL